MILPDSYAFGLNLLQGIFEELYTTLTPFVPLRRLISVGVVAGFSRDPSKNSVQTSQNALTKLSRLFPNLRRIFFEGMQEIWILSGTWKRHTAMHYQIKSDYFEDWEEISKKLHFFEEQ
jgi:hypothetical protein